MALWCMVLLVYPSYHSHASTNSKPFSASLNYKLHFEANETPLDLKRRKLASHFESKLDRD